MRGETDTGNTEILVWQEKRNLESNMEDRVKRWEVNNKHQKNYQFDRDNRSAELCIE